MTYTQQYPVDVWYWWWATSIRVASLARFGSYLGILTCWPAVLYLVWNEVLVFMRWGLDSQRRCRWRASLVVASRLLHCLEIATGSVNFVSAFTFFGNDQGPTHPLFVGLSFLMAQGVVPMVFLGLFLPLSFKMDLPLQLGSCVFLLSILGPEICRHTGGGTLPGTGWIFKTLDALALQEAQAVFGTFSRMDITWTVEFPCLQMSMFAQIYISFGVISYIVWLFEYRSRLAFIEELSTVERHNTVVKPLNWFDCCVHLVVFLAAFGALWIGFLFVTPNNISWRV